MQIFRRHFPFVKQKDAMQCGIASLSMICRYYGKKYSTKYLSELCHATIDGVSMLAMSETATKLGLITMTAYVSPEDLLREDVSLPAILHWNQNHFVVLYKTRHKFFYIADPGKGLIKYSYSEFIANWISTTVNDKEKGIAMFIEPTPDFYEKSDNAANSSISFKFLMHYIHDYQKLFAQIFLGLLLGCLLQLIMPFLTQSIVDIGIRDKDIGFIWLILLGQLMIVVGRTATDFVRRWLLLHISMRINISLVSDFFIKLLKLPMSFFDTKLMGDLLQRIGDHSRVQNFLTGQVLNVVFTSLSFIIFGFVLLVYDKAIFGIFVAGSIVYGLWISVFLRRRKVLDYELFEQEAINRDKTYRFITSMQEIKLQGCEQRRRWEWEDVQAGLFGVRMKSLKLQQTQEAGSIFNVSSTNSKQCKLCVNSSLDIDTRLLRETAVRSDCA